MNRLEANSCRRMAPCGALLAVLGALCATPAQARDSVPSTPYFNTFNAYYEGDYRDALKAFQDEGRGGIKNGTVRWIDSICYHTMTGEAYYQMGDLPKALDQYTAALNIYLDFPDWMIRVQFPAIPEAGAGAIPQIPWGRSKRNARIGHFPDTMSIAQGQIDQSQVVRNGGVVQQAMLFPVHVDEVVRCTALAMRRRRELMGPLCKHDPLTGKLLVALGKRPAPPNHWSGGWVDLELGMAHAAAGNTAQAVTLLERSIILAGEFDHRLTSTALLELGRLSLEGGNTQAAARYFEEATYSAVVFLDLGVLEEAFRYGQMTHLMSNQKGIYPPLVPAINWAKTKGYRQLHASLSILAAENIAVLGTSPKDALAMLNDARATVGHHDMVNGALGARLNFTAALLSFQAGNLQAGEQALAAALAYQKGGSFWLFQIQLADSLCTSGSVTSRIALQLYDLVLRDPAPADWASSPLECLSVLTNSHLAPLEHWFDIAMNREGGHELALEIADRTRRHRFFSTLPLGGRLLALRWVLEGPEEALGDLPMAQRQELLDNYPRYRELADKAKRVRKALANQPMGDGADLKQQGKQLASLAEIAQQQEIILREIAVRRDPAEMVFPPLRKTKEVQAALPKGKLLLVFFATSKNLYAFALSSEKYASWRVAAPASVQKQLTALLRELGNWDQNHAIGQTDLSQATWKKTAAKILDLLTEKSKIDLSASFDELIVVPDGMLWYLPFEVLPVKRGNETKPLVTQLHLRYAPTLGLAVPYSQVRKPVENVGVVAGKLYPRDDEATARTAFDQLSRSVPGATLVPSPAPVASSVYRLLYDELIALDETKPSDGGWYDWSPAQVDRAKSAGWLSAWLSLPFGGPSRVILPGFHTICENGLKKEKGVLSGNDVFLPICGLMSTGARTILISRWRAGGQTSFDLVREFAQELPHTTAADAWQRSVQLAIDTQLDPSLEPRLKKLPPNAAIPNAEHPFFWSGYMLVDTGSAAEPAAEEAENNPPIAAKPAPPAAKPDDGGEAVAEADDRAMDDPPAQKQPKKKQAVPKPAGEKAADMKLPDVHEIDLSDDADADAAAPKIKGKQPAAGKKKSKS